MAKLCRGLSFAVVVLYFTMVEAQNPREPHSGGQWRQSLCEADITFDDRGIIRWPSTRPGDIVDRRCPFSQNNTMRAWRECLALSSGANWSRANTSDCVPEDKASRGRRLVHLANTTIPRGQSGKVSRQLVNLTAEAEAFDAGDVALSADVVWNLLENCENGTDVDVAKDILESVGNLLKVGRGVLKASQKNQNAAARLVQAIERLSQTLIPGNDATGGCNKSVTIETPNFAMVVTEIDPSTFAGLKFKRTAEKIEFVEEFYDDDSQNSTTKEDGSSISLPPTLFDGLDESALDQANRVQFVSHKCSTLFEAIDDSTSVGLSPVTAAGIGGLKIGNLSDPVKIKLSHKDKNRGPRNVSCVFWDFNLNGRHEALVTHDGQGSLNIREGKNANHQCGSGGWSADGCTVSSDNKDGCGTTICECNHLTNFALLGDIDQVSSANQKGPSIIAIAGIVISFPIFVVIDWLMVIAIEDV